MIRALTILAAAALAGSAQPAAAGDGDGAAVTARVVAENVSLTAPLGSTKGSVVEAIIYNGHAGLGAS